MHRTPAKYIPFTCSEWRLMSDFSVDRLVGPAGEDVSEYCEGSPVESEQTWPATKGVYVKTGADCHGRSIRECVSVYTYITEEDEFTAALEALTPDEVFELRLDSTGENIIHSVVINPNPACFDILVEYLMTVASGPSLINALANEQNVYHQYPIELCVQENSFEVLVNHTIINSSLLGSLISHSSFVAKYFHNILSEVDAIKVSEEELP